MEKTLELNLNSEKEIVLEKHSKNILENISDAFSNAIKKGTDLINLPDNWSEEVKSGLEKIDLKEIGESVVETALKAGMKSLGMKTSTFNSLTSIFDAVKEGDLKKGLDSGFNITIGMLKIPTNVKTLLKNGKDVVLDQVFEDELKIVMTKQKNTISRIDRKCVQMEEAFQKNDAKTLDRISKTLKTDLEKVMPIQDVIKRGQLMLNQYKLYKNKGNKALTQEEKDLCITLSAV